MDDEAQFQGFLRKYEKESEDCAKVSLLGGERNTHMGSPPLQDPHTPQQELLWRRSKYKCGDKFVVLSEIKTWYDYLKLEGKKTPEHAIFTGNDNINRKVSLWFGDITHLEIDAIVNAAKPSLLGGGGIDGAIHKAAGHGLVQECAFLGGCEPGQAKITQGYKLPAKHVIHTVGPIGQKPTVLQRCYRSVLKKAASWDIKSMAFCCISTGIYGYPNKPAAHVALQSVREWLESGNNQDKIDRIIFCLFTDEDEAIYSKLMLECYFPPT
eukprot:TRINITY_DN5926_c0_g3_i3.p1 TRINITY_DN5926_c0_g3~~TRINITY_DN5926_c0_g3_i3.p1  ORF type:complete len:310 (-),score=119.73 TRINITY_DN5926_c0_g3_i3:129-932(-)